MQTVTVDEATANLARLIERAAAGEAILITREGAGGATRRRAARLSASHTGLVARTNTSG